MNQVRCTSGMKAGQHFGLITRITNTGIRLFMRYYYDLYQLNENMNNPRDKYSDLQQESLKHEQNSRRYSPDRVVIVPLGQPAPGE